MNKEFVTVLTGNQVSDVIVAGSLLEDAGIEIRLADELINQLNPLYATAVGGVKLQVLKEERELAVQLLTEGNFLNYQEETGEDVTETGDGSGVKMCPYCGSENISKPEISRQAFGLSVLLLGFQLPFLSKKLFCFDCRKNFRAKTTKP
ncbi:MAG: hypothetical protein V4658_02595 [Bacteroidota bacterium]